jgi:hypothetical protein
MMQTEKEQTGLTSENFIREIDKMVNDLGLTYVDAVVHFCEKNNIEIETAASIVKTNSAMKSKLQADYETLNYLPKRAKLPI